MAVMEMKIGQADQLNWFHCLWITSVLLYKWVDSGMSWVVGRVREGGGAGVSVFIPTKQFKKSVWVSNI